jgi:hypothetical protein
MGHPPGPIFSLGGPGQIFYDPLPPPDVVDDDDDHKAVLLQALPLNTRQL